MSIYILPFTSPLTSADTFYLFRFIGSLIANVFQRSHLTDDGAKKYNNELRPPTAIQSVSQPLPHPRISENSPVRTRSRLILSLIPLALSRQLTNLSIYTVVVRPRVCDPIHPSTTTSKYPSRYTPPQHKGIAWCMSLQTRFWLARVEQSLCLRHFGK